MSLDGTIQPENGSCDNNKRSMARALGSGFSKSENRKTDAGNRKCKQNELQDLPAPDAWSRGRKCADRGEHYVN
jgi:hypothetical protein